MKQWVLLRDVAEIPNNITVSARASGSYFFAAYSRVLDQWYLVVPGHGEEKIPPPEAIFVESEAPEPWQLPNPDQLELNL